MSEIRNVIVELLGQFSANREAQDYLLRFASVQNNQFAVIKVGGGVVAKELEDLASALAFLRHVGLFPIVLHGAGPQLNAALQAEVTDLQQGLDAIEEHAREDLGMIKKGETFYQVVE